MQHSGTQGKNTGKGIKRKLHPFHPHAIPYDFPLSDEQTKSFRKKSREWDIQKLHKMNMTVTHATR